MLDEELRAMCTQRAWVVLPSTAKGFFGSPTIPSTGRDVGPIPCHVTWEHSIGRSRDGEEIALAGSVQLATTEALSTGVIAVRVAASSSAPVFASNPVARVIRYHDEDGIHHTSLVIGY